MLASSFSTRFLLRKNRRSRLPAPLGPLFCRPRHGSAAPGPQRQNPGPPRFQLGFCCAKIGAAGYRPHLLGLPRKSGRGISLRETTLCGCPLRGHGFATPHRYFAVPVTAPPRRAPNGKTPALAPIRSHFACGETALAGHRPHRGRRFAVPVTAAPRRVPNGKTPALAPIRSHFACGETALAGHRPHRGRRFAVPVTAAPRRVPNGKTPALAPIRSHFACGETARPVVAPAGGNVLATPFSLRSNVAPHIPAGSAGVRSFVPRLAPRSHPGACSHSVAFRSAKPRSRSLPPLSDGGALTKSENIILCASSCHPPRSPYPHCTLPHVRFSGIGQKKKPQRKTAAAVNTLYMSCKKTSVNPISFPVALCTKISPFKAIHLLSQCKTKIQFLWMRMRKRSAN